MEQKTLVKVNPHDTIRGEIVYQNGEPYQLLPMGEANNINSNRGFTKFVKGAAIGLAAIVALNVLKPATPNITVVNNNTVVQPKQCGIRGGLFGC